MASICMGFNDFAVNLSRLVVFYLSGQVLMQPFGRSCWIALTFLAVGFAQKDPPGRVGRLNYVTGTVSFQPGGVDEWVNANLNRPLTTGDHLWVDENGRAELHIGAAALRLSSRTFFEFLNLDDQNVQIRLGEGSIEVKLRYLDENETFEVDTPNLAFSLTRPGTYRIDANPDNQTTTVTVRNGQGEINGGGQAFQVNGREQARVTGDQSITYDVSGAPPPDWFDTFCDSRDRREDQSRSAQFVSRDTIGYEDLDNAGDWRPVAEYGTVWYPRNMPHDWAPYRYGHWAWIEPWGWTWVDDAPWGFAPFHYGRWALIGGGWGWVPGPPARRPVYAPALVAFVGGSRFNLSLSIGGGGGVAWFPLGPREAYVPAYRASPTYVTRVNNITVINNVNITNNNITNIRYVNQTAPGAVTAVSRETFVGARSVGRSTVPVNAQELASAQVMHTAAYAPSQASVLGRGAGEATRARPPEAVINRAVVARATPPPAPVAFRQRERVLQQNPGQPLEAQQVQQIRSQQPMQQNRMVRQATTVPNQGQPSAPAGGRRGFADTAPAQQPQAQPPQQDRRNPSDRRQAVPPQVAAPTQQPQYQDRRMPVDRGQQQAVPPQVAAPTPQPQYRDRREPTPAPQQQAAPPQVAAPAPQPQYRDRRERTPVPQQQAAPPQVSAPAPQPQYQDRRIPAERPQEQPRRFEAPRPQQERRQPPVERSQPRVEAPPTPEHHVDRAPRPEAQNEGRRERPAPAKEEKKDDRKKEENKP